ncbi:ABC transporter permease [Sulfurospirillum diekertiae]|uniref:ABC transporter permease n=1 Tax=Sulfurospirillum diekertiae TaxID=1854492 RepID=A0A6G9VSE6_9BACT|nr:ABC transporter permease [Sulfurospirillum diekertiae]QIR75893.1 ABC transporter permease [Sulfurospirillum diekertiae]QIR78533.1 ABC transporter permease [Sulfurospirillum diekertiae]
MISLAQRDIAHSLGKFLTTSAGIGMLLGVVLIMIGVYRGLVDDANILLKDTQANLWIVQQDTLGPFAENSRLHEDMKYQMKVFAGVKDVSAITFQNLQLYRNNQPIRVFAMGYDVGSFYMPHLLIEGRPILANHFEMIVDKKTGFKLHDEIVIGRDIFHVVGITEDAVSSSGDLMVYFSLPDAQKLQFLSSNEQIRNDRARGNKATDTTTINAIIATVEEGADLKAIAQEIERWKHVKVFTQEEQSSLLTKNLIERSAKQIGMFTVILLLVASVIISLIIYTMTMGKLKEIAILKLIGASNAVIIKMIVQQSVLLGILSFIAGTIFSHSLMDLFPKRTILMSADAFSLLVIVIIVSILGSLFGVRSALKIDPASAIGG